MWADKYFDSGFRRITAESSYFQNPVTAARTGRTANKLALARGTSRQVDERLGWRPRIYPGPDLIELGRIER